MMTVRHQWGTTRRELPQLRFLYLCTISKPKQVSNRSGLGDTRSVEAAMKSRRLDRKLHNRRFAASLVIDATAS